MTYPPSNQEYNVDYIIAETFEHLAEASIALEVTKEYEIPAVVTMSTLFSDGISKDGFSPSESCVELKRLGADVVGLNCSRGPGDVIYTECDES